MEDLKERLRRSIEDFRLSRRERREIIAELESLGANSYHIDKARDAAFELVRTCASTDLPAALDWLEAVINAARPKPQSLPKSEACFSPGDACAARVRELIALARTHMDICVFTITDNRIVEKLMQAHRRGVRLRIVSDDLKSEDTGSDIGRLAKAGIAIALDRTDAHMHHKFAIFDSETLISGSYNWTRSAAAENNENLIVSNDRSLVVQFEAEFERLWKTLEH